MFQADLFNETQMPSKKHDPGGKVRLALKHAINSTAVFGGPSDCYRYRLTRSWDAEKPHAMFVMMNPSTADPQADDPTVAKCGRFARAWQYGGIFVGNTFAYRATDQKRLMKGPDPVGPENDTHLIEMAKEAAIVIFSSGQPCHATLRPRGLALARLLMKEEGVTPHTLRLAKNGTPWHPLYLPETLKPVVWQL
jgi:hypothetical protein